MLVLNLIPKTSFYKNLRSEVPKSKWDEIRKACYKQATYMCEICGGTGSRHPVECHELWEYSHGVQTLKRLIAECPACHEVNHYGFAGVRGRTEIAKKHLMKVNHWTIEQANDHIHHSWKTWADRNQTIWKLDMSPIYRDDALQSLFGTGNRKEELQKAAVRECAHSITFIKNPSEQVQLTLVESFWYGIEYLDNPSDKVQLAAVVADTRAYELIDNPSIMATLAHET